jgi:hypothetical protein
MPWFLFDLVLQNAGATQPKRDAVDSRIVNETRNGTVTYGGHGDSCYAALQKLDTSKVYGIIDSEADVGGWPVLNSLPAPIDTDHDGMPDDWELAHQLDPNKPDDRNLIGPNGYTMVETYLNQLVYGNPSTETEVAKQESRPTQFALEQNYPNPFNPTTAISYQLSALSWVELKIFDVLGREVATLVNDVRPAGVYTQRWDGSACPSGVYLYQLKAGQFEQTKKMILIK